MIEEFKTLLTEAEAQHDKLVVLHAVNHEKLITAKHEDKRLLYLLSSSQGRISAYKKALEILTNHGGE